jgi:hypothetical protein
LTPKILGFTKNSFAFAIFDSDNRIMPRFGSAADTSHLFAVRVKHAASLSNSQFIAATMGGEISQAHHQRANRIRGEMQCGRADANPAGRGTKPQLSAFPSSGKYGGQFRHVRRPAEPERAAASGLLPDHRLPAAFV